MKNNLLLLFMCLTQLSFAQLTQIKELNGINLTLNVINSNDFLLAKDTTSIQIYDENFNIKKTISDLPKFEGVYLSSKNVFTLSGKFEFILAIKNNTSYIYKLYNEDKQFLFDFGEYYPYTFSNGKLVAYKMNLNSNRFYYDMKIFSVSGNIGLSSIENFNDKLYAYPNPANHVINIKYKIEGMEMMEIINVQGRVIENRLLDPSVEEIKFDISRYQKGMYIYRIKDLTGKFIVE